MTAQFLRDEAARFRGMAEDTDREATKVRLLAMAADYEARARVAAEVAVAVVNESADADPGEANVEAVEPAQDTPTKITLNRTMAAGLKETTLVQRRTVGRPRRE